MRAFLLLPLLALALPTTAFAEAPADALAPLAPSATMCAQCEKASEAPPSMDPVRRGGGIALTVLASVGIAGSIATMIAGKAMTHTEVCYDDGTCLPDIMDASSLVITGAVSLGFSASLLPFGIVLLGTDAWKYDDAPKAAVGAPFAIDARPPAVAPRYWLGEF